MQRNFRQLPPARRRRTCHPAAVSASFPPVISHSSSRGFWESRTTALARRINVGAWLALAAPAAFGVATLFAVLVYALRRLGQPLDVVWLSLFAAVVAVGTACWWRARRRFFQPADARVLLESQLRLDSRLTAATMGLVPWPAAPMAMPAILQWRLHAPLGWAAAALALIAGAAFAPIPHDTTPIRPTGSPPSLLQTQEMLAALKEMQMAEPQALQQLEDRAQELARRPTEEQYSHSALEAADALRDQTEISAAALGRGLETAANALRSANDGGDLSGPAGQLAAALSGLRDGALPANKALLANLPASAGDLKNLTAEQRAQLAQQLANAAKGLRGISGAMGAGAQVAQPDGEAMAGGPGGGGDSAPLMLAGQQSDAGDGNAEALGAGDLKRFALGDKLGTMSGAHRVDPNAAEAPLQAGAVAAPAKGGDAVWVNRLTPTERAAVKNFFK